MYIKGYMEALMCKTIMDKISVKSYSKKQYLNEPPIRHPSTQVNLV